MKKLPVKIDAIITSECWTYYKMAIIETSPHRLAWLASHMELYLHHDFWSCFGENSRMYPLKYFEDILSIHEIPLHQVNVENIIQRIIDEIQSGYYIIIDCNFPKLFSETYEGFHLHETLLYGFDQKKKVFFSSVLIKSRKPEEIEIPFNNFIKSFYSVYSYFKENPQAMTERKNYFYNITRLKLKDDYCEDNSIYLMLRKIDYEIRGIKSISSCFNEHMEVISDNEYYTGIACLIVLQTDIQKLCTESDIPNDISERLTKTLKRLHEHRNIIFLSMKWLIKKLKINDPNVIDSVTVYKKCCDNMNKLYLMAYKFEVTRDMPILNRIQNQLSEQYRLEYVTLLQFNDSAKSCYYLSQKLK